MIDISITDHYSLLAFFIVFTRVISFLIQIPIFEQVNIPAPVKVFFALFISLVFYSSVKNIIFKELNYFGEEHFWIVVILHALIGLIMGFFVKAIMQIFYISGQLITQQIGLSAVKYFDPNVSEQVGPFEKIIQWTMLMILLNSGVLYPFFSGLYQSFFSINIMNLNQISYSPEFFMDFFKTIFVAGISLSMPMIIVNVIIAIIMGIISRMIPQLNILMVSFVVNIGVGLIIYSLTMTEYFFLGKSMYANQLGPWLDWVKGP